MEWLKKHVDTTIILTAFASSLIWMNGKFNELEKDIAKVEKEIAVIKAVLFMKNILPSEFCKNDDIEERNKK